MLVVTDIEPRGWGRRHYFSVLAAAAAVALVWGLARTPASALQWASLALVSPIAGLVLTVVVEQLLKTVRYRWLRSWHRQLAALLVAVVVLALVLTGITVAVVFPGRPQARVPSCEHPSELRILAAPSRFEAARELATGYEQWTAEHNDGCARVRAYVYVVPPDPAVDALAAGWSALPELGPRPDLWLPDSRSEVDQVREAIQGTDTPLAGIDEVVAARSPLVLAVTKTAVPVEAAPARVDGLAWTELLDTVDRVGWDQEVLVRPDPAVSDIGVLAIAALYGAGGEADLAFAHAVENRVDEALAAGYPAADTDPLHDNALLAHHRTLGAAAATIPVLVTEQALVRYNGGGSNGDGCMETDGSLVAFYPSEPITSDYPVVRLSWRQPPGQAAAAGAFRGWLATPAGVDALIQLGLRPAGTPVEELTDPIDEACGALPEALPPGLAGVSPDAAAVEAARTVYQKARRPGRVLLALDNSGSMARSVDGELTRRDVAARAVEEALHRLGPRDEFGLWAFPRPDGAAEQELVEIGPAIPDEGVPRAQAAAEELADLDPPTGETPLYRTIVAGVDEVGEDMIEGEEGKVTAVVVVTDGEDTEHDSKIAERLATLGGDGVRVHVVAVGEASCRIADLETVTSETGGECVDAAFDTLDRQLADLFGVLWSGG